MPIYEFYCGSCNTIYSFFSRKVNTQTTPKCPGCKRDTLERRVSRFATARKGAEKSTDSDGEAGDLPIDESKMEKAVESLASEAEGLDESDPRAAAKLMRKLSDATGLQYNEKMEQALSRLEAGEDPEAIEAEMGDQMENMDDAFVLPGRKPGTRKRAAPKRDDTLYEM